MKVVTSEHISPFGGLNFVFEELDKLGIGDKLHEGLPGLSPQTFYDWRDLLYSLWAIPFCGGSCVEDLGKNLEGYLSNTPLIKVPSPDRVLDRMRELAEGVNVYDTPKGHSTHEFCHNEKLNRLNIKLLKGLSGYKSRGVTLDYDNTLLFTNKNDARFSYKNRFGYAPGVAFIGKKVVFVENRNGNSDAQTLQQDTLLRIFTLLKEQNITVRRFRADAASYQLSTLRVITQHTESFCIKARMSETLYGAINGITKWKEIKRGNEIVHRGECAFNPFQATQDKQSSSLPNVPYRLIVTKAPRKDGQINAFTGEACIYAGILTNDKELSTDGVVDFYNQRGAIEKEFDVLKNDFCWDQLPFSKMEYNNVFLILMGMCRNLYDHIIRTFTRKYEHLRVTDRIKKFIFRFICIPAKWFKQGRQWKLRLYGRIEMRT